MKRIRIFMRLLLLAPFLLFVSCHSTKVLSSWSISNPPAEAMKKVLVLGVMRNMGERSQMEETMVNELNQSGIVANSATSIFGPNGFKGLSEEEMTGKLKNSAYSSVLIISLVDKKKEQNYTPGSRYMSPRVVGYNRYYRRYLVVYDQIYTPGYYTSSTNYILEAEIYSIDSDELIYSAQTKSYDPGSSKVLGESFARSIVSELKIKGIIPAQTSS